MSDGSVSQNDSTDETEDVGVFWETSKHARLERHGPSHPQPVSHTWTNRLQNCTEGRHRGPRVYSWHQHSGLGLDREPPARKGNEQHLYQ